jgi:hypothetical protein
MTVLKNRFDQSIAMTRQKIKQKSNSGDLNRVEFRIFSRDRTRSEELSVSRSLSNIFIFILHLVIDVLYWSFKGVYSYQYYLQ